MAIPAVSPRIAPPHVRDIVTPVLSALPGAAASTQPATAVLPSLSPILRQRVQLLSSASTEPWIRLLTYDTAKVPQLTSIARSGSLDAHPVSGEIELDWDRDVDVRFKRLDQETLQTMVILKDLSLFFRLVYCTGDPDGGGDGWRVGEVGAADSSTLAAFGGASDINEAEKLYQATLSTDNWRSAASVGHAASGMNGTRDDDANDADDDDDDDAYWARYDATPSRTPATKRSPAPRSVVQPLAPHIQRSESVEAEDAYFAQYDSVQPAMDNHDPDEEIHHAEYAQPVEARPPLGLEGPEPALAMPVPVKAGLELSSSGSGDETTNGLVHPRPASSASSSGSQTVARLEGVAESRQQAEFGVKQHISRSIRSLFLLSRASGIDRDEFERMVRTELDVLGMLENDI